MKEKEENWPSVNIAAQAPSVHGHLGHDKLKYCGILVCGCNDGFSERFMWLEITSLNKMPKVISQYYLKTVKRLSPLSANPTKWSNSLKQFISNLLTNCLSMFDHFVKLVLKGLRVFKKSR